MLTIYFEKMEQCSGRQGSWWCHTSVTLPDRFLLISPQRFLWGMIEKKRFLALMALTSHMLSLNSSVINYL